MGKSMRWNKKFEIRDRSIERINRIYNSAIKYQYNSDELFNKIQKEVFDKIPNGFPQYMTEYLKGYERCWNNRITYELMEFCYVMNNNIIVSVERTSERYYEKLNINVRDLTNKPNGRYWKNSDKLFFGDK